MPFKVVLVDWLITQDKTIDFVRDSGIECLPFDRQAPNLVLPVTTRSSHEGLVFVGIDAFLWLSTTKPTKATLNRCTYYLGLMTCVPTCEL